MQSIVAAIDFGPASVAVAEHAADLAARFGASLTLLHVYQVVAVDEFGAMPAFPPSTDKEELEAYAVSLRARYGESLRVTTVTDHGVDVGSTILTHARQADFVVLGQTENHGVWRFFFGDVTARVIDDAFCPVLVVPIDRACRPPKHLVYAAGERLPQAASFAPLRTLAAELDAQVEVYHVVRERSEGHGQELERLLGDTPWRYVLESGERGLARFIAARADRVEGSWIVITHHHRGLVGQLFSRSLSERLAAVASMPVLVLIERAAVAQDTNGQAATSVA